MSLSAKELEDILVVVRAAAQDAARLVLGGFRQARSSLKVEHKGVVDLVTQFDHESEDLLRDRLACLKLPIIGEEHGGDRDVAGGLALYVDPIDGTTNFVHGHPFWCVSIGLVALSSGEPILGVVLAPAVGLEWVGWLASSGDRRAVRRTAQNAILGLEPHILEEPCRVSATTSFDEAMLATGFPSDRRTSADNNFDAFVHIKRRCQAVRRCGSAAMDLCLVADGTYDGYWERKLNPWDIAAGIAIARAAGGVVTDFEGGSMSLATGRVIATNGPLLHERLSQELAPFR